MLSPDLSSPAGDKDEKRPAKWDVHSSVLAFGYRGPEARLSSDVSLNIQP